MRTTLRSVEEGSLIVARERKERTGTLPGDLFVTVEEMPDGTFQNRGQTTVTPDASGNPKPVTIAYTPMEVGEKKFILEVPPVLGETNTRNNKLERSVLVTDQDSHIQLRISCAIDSAASK